MVGTGGRTELTEGDLLQAFCQFAKSGDYYDSPTRSFNEAGYAVLNERNRDGYLMHHQTVNALAYLGLFESPDQLSARDLTLMNYLWPRMAPLKDGKCTYDRFRSVVQSHVRSATREHEELLMMQHSGAAGAANRRNRDYSTRDVSPEFTYRLAGSPERLMSPSPLPDKRPGLMSPTLRPAERNERNMGGQSSPMLRPAHRKSGLISPQPRREYKSESGSPAAASRDAEPASASADTSWDHSRRSRQSSSSSSSHGASQRNDRALKDSIAALREDLRILVKERKAWEANSRSRGDKSSSAGDSDSDDGSLSRKKRSLVEEVDYLHARVIKERELKRKREEATRARERQSLADREAAERQSWDAYDRDRTTANKEMMAIPVNMTVYLGSGAVYSDLRRGGLPAVRNWKKAAAKDLGDGFQISRGDVRPHVKEVEPNLIRVLFHVLAPADEAGKMKAVLEGRLRQYPTLRLEEASRSFERESRVPSGCFLRMNSSWVGRPKPSTKQSDSEVQKGDVSFLVDQPYETFRAAPFHAAMKRHKDNPKMYMDMVDVRQKKKKPVVTFRVSGTGDDAGHSRRLVASANDERSPIHRDVTRISKAWLVDGSKRGASSSSSSSSSQQVHTTDHHVYTWAAAAPVQTTATSPDDKPQDAPNRVAKPLAKKSRSSSSSSSSSKGNQKDKVRATKPHAKKARSSSSSSSDRKPNDNVVTQQVYGTEHHVYRREEAAPVQTTQTAPVHKPTPHDEADMHSVKSWSSVSSDKEQHVVHQVHDTEHHVYQRGEASPVLTTLTAPVDKPTHDDDSDMHSVDSHSPSSSSSKDEKHATEHRFFHQQAVLAPVDSAPPPPRTEKTSPPKGFAKMPPPAPPVKARSSSSSSSSSSSDRKPKENVVHQTYATEHRVIHRKEASPVVETKMSPVHKPSVAPPTSSASHSPSSGSDGKPKEQFVHQTYDTVHSVVHRKQSSTALETKVTTSDQSLPSTPGPSNEQKPVPKRKKHRRRASASPSPARSSSSSSTSTGERGKRRQPAAPRMKTPPVSGSPSSGSSGRAPPHGTRKSPHNAPHVVGPGGAGSSASSGASSVLRIGGVKGPLAVKTSAPALVPPPLASPMSSFGHQRQQQSSDEEGEVDTFKC
ncbi:hypothetical protein DIPPA_09354 [Diplonema papillatum]|nr:hypothetical protein DIPPA_09354 [Diplonema papillatum]